MGIGRAIGISSILDFMETLILIFALFLASILSPFKGLRMPKLLCYIRVLLPNGLLSSALRAAIDLKISHTDRAIATLEGLIASIEETRADGAKHLRARVLVLADLYGCLARAHLYRGQIEDASLAVIRASRSIGVERLAGLPDFDVKTAQVAKAAVAAGRILEQRESVQVLIEHDSGEPRCLQLSNLRKSKFANYSNKKLNYEKIRRPSMQAKVIPFPHPS